MKAILQASALFLIVSTAVAQVRVTVGPNPAPVGCPIKISISNDTASAITLSNPCPFQVKIQGGPIVYSPICIQIIVNVNAGAVFTTEWNQINNSGVQVAPGNYVVDVFLPSGMASNSVTIDASEDAGLISLGAHKTGTNRNLFLCAPGDGTFTYAMACSGPPLSGGIPTCGGTVPLEPDALLTLSINPNPFFLNFVGTLNATGKTTAPSISVPSLPGLVSASFVVAYVVLDPLAPCIIRSISAPMIVVIV